MILNSNNNYNSFGAMQKSQFKGIDRICVDTFKAPIEKFNSNEDLQKWASNKLVTDVFSKDLEGRTPRCTIERNAVLKNWKEFFEKAVTLPATAALLVSSAIFGKLSSKSDDVPPPIDEKVLNKTLNDLNEKQPTNIQNKYLSNLKTELVGMDIDNYTGWIVIPSEYNDSKNYEKNLEKLKLLSSSHWCTKSSKADMHLMKGDFHILYENGKPKLGIQMTYDDEIDEIQGTDNNNVVPLAYINKIEDYMKQNKYHLSDRADSDFQMAKIKAKDIERAKTVLAADIDSKNYKNIFKHFNINYTENPDGTVILDKYNDYYGYGEMGIDVQDMLKNVVEIQGDADFTNTPAKDLSNLQKIGGYADFTDANITNLSNLKSIGKNAFFKNSQVENLNSLESCPKLDISYSKIKELPNFKEGKVTSNIEVKTPLLKG